MHISTEYPISVVYSYALCYTKITCAKVKGGGMHNGKPRS